MESTELGSSPSIPALYARAGLGGLTGMLRRDGGEDLPERELTLSGAELEAERVAGYARVCGFTVRNEVPGTFPHILAFPLQLKLMTDPGFPFAVLGLVHVANEIEVLGEISVGSSLDFAVRAEDLREHPRGRQLDLISTATQDGATLWRSRSTYLKVERRKDPSGERSERRSTGAELTAAAEWELPGDLGRRYGAVSGDRNPIHMSSLSARAFGFPGTIIHGMWTKARTLAAFEADLPESYRIGIEFKAPLRIPGRAKLLSGHAAGDRAFRVESPDGERTHATGSIASLRG